LLPSYCQEGACACLALRCRALAGPSVKQRRGRKLGQAAGVWQAAVRCTSPDRRVQGSAPRFAEPQVFSGTATGACVHRPACKPPALSSLRLVRVDSGIVLCKKAHSSYVRRLTRGAVRRPGDTIELEAAQAHEAADVQVAWPIRLRGGGAAPEDTLLLCPRGADAALVFRRVVAGMLQACDARSVSPYHPWRAQVQHRCVLFEEVFRATKAAASPPAHASC